MKVLFICSGNRSGKPGNILWNQAESIREEGAEVFFYLITDKGISGYLKHIFKLRKYLRGKDFDILHAHYSFSGFTAAMACRKPLVVSLMGSDAYLSGLLRKVISLFARFCWDATIVKTKEMSDLLKLKKAKILPNGVDLARFCPGDKNEARKTLGLPAEKKIILFLADPSRSEKNFPLAMESVNLLDRNDVLLIPVFNEPNDTIPDYMNAADLLFLTSKWEGSVNVVKEAMACNLPIISTDVGDVRRNILNIKHCYIGESTPADLCSKLALALENDKRTNGREMLISLGLDSKTVAQKIIEIYREVIKN